MTFWQGLAITLLAETTDVGSSNDGDADEWAMSAQNFLICLEMLLFSIAHFYCFPTDEWEDGYKANHQKGGFGETLALGDFMADLKLILTSQKSPRKKKRNRSESPILEEDEESGITGLSSNGSNTSVENENTDLTTATNVSGNSNSSGGAAMALSDALNQNPDEIEDPELQEARNRIIASGFLNDLSFFSSGTARAPPSHLNGDVDQTNNEESTSDDNLQPQRPDEIESYQNNSNWDAASENTGLLSTSSAHSELRPSIFTTIANLSQQQDEQERIANTPAKDK